MPHQNYCVQFSTGDKVLIAGVRELCKVKRETYVSGTNEIIDDICEKECEKERILN